MNSTLIRSPKQRNHKQTAWYPYYAGYSVEFTSDALKFLTGGERSTVLDPWNGSGTTTTVAVRSGHSAIGLDSNPALILIARARNVIGSSESLRPLSVEVAEAVARDRTLTVLAPSDPLLQWFKKPAAAELRSYQRAIELVFVEEERRSDDLDRLSDLAAFYYTAAFEAVRTMLSQFRSSNPTWLRVPLDHRNRIMPSKETIRSVFLDSVSRLASRLSAQEGVLVRDQRCDEAQITLGDSRDLQMPDASVEASLSSPPYCTRIDYVVSARAELAFLGIDDSRMKQLREVCVGAPTVSGVRASSSQNRLAKDVLDAVLNHGTYAAQSYYARYFENYFADIEDSLRELDRVVESSGRIGLVVQDSYFKDVHIDLAAIVTSILHDLGREQIYRTDYAARSTRATMNPRATRWIKDRTTTESFVAFS